MSGAPDELDLAQTIRGFSAGQKVFGRYALVRILGGGGMDLVWQVRDEKLDREVALNSCASSWRVTGLMGWCVIRAASMSSLAAPLRHEKHRPARPRKLETRATLKCDSFA